MSDEVPAGAGVMPTGAAAGQRVAGYLLVEQVGAGGMAVVFRAWDEQLRREVALKVLVPGLAANEEFRRRFLRESRAAAAVDDPHIIPVYEAGESGGVLFIAMRYVSGGDVWGLLRRQGPLPAGRATAIISPVASALDAAHRAGLVHRDLKPGNMLVDVREGRPDHVYLTDFGLSKGAMSSADLTGTGQIMGTPSYMAPEQIEGRTVDGRTDQYALACVAFELLAGEPPFLRDQDIAVLHAHLHQPPPLLSSRRPGLPVAADQVLARALAKAPADRFASCHEFADALRESLGLPPYHSIPDTIPNAAAGRLVTEPGQTTGRHPETISSVTAPPSQAEPGPDTHDGPGQGRKPRRRKMLAVWAAGAAAVVAALIGAYVAWGPHGSAPGPHVPTSGSHPPASGSHAPAGSNAPASGSHGSSATSARVYSGESYGFNAPNRIATDTSHVWVTNPGGSSVTELNASDGSLVQVLTGASYGFDHPVGIADDGTHIWIANTNSNAVTELNASDGRLVQVLTSVSYGFSRPYAIADDGTHVWVVNTNGNSVTELNASDGSLVQVLTGASYGFDGMAAIAVVGTHVWVANATGNSVTELNASDGSLVQVLTGASYGFSGPRAFALDGTHVWVANTNGNSVTELNASDGSWVATLSGPSYGFYGPWDMTAEGTHVWITNSDGNSVTELTAG